MEQLARQNNKKKSGIIVIGSLNPDKDCQDRVRVLSAGGVVNH